MPRERQIRSLICSANKIVLGNGNLMPRWLRAFTVRSGTSDGRGCQHRTALGAGCNANFPAVPRQRRCVSSAPSTDWTLFVARVPYENIVPTPAVGRHPPQRTPPAQDHPSDDCALTLAVQAARICLMNGQGFMSQTRLEPEARVPGTGEVTRKPAAEFRLDSRACQTAG